jgi:V8-like Glu-specific endopeptidase
MNNLAYPHRVHIVFDNAGSTAVIESSNGSGTLIGPSTALSAAHVFWDEDNSTWEPDHRWAPGFDSQDADPSPWGEWFRCYWVSIPVGYIALETHDFDYAVVDFDAGCNSVRNGVNSDHPGSTVGWLGHYTASATEIEARTGHVRGYPGPGSCGIPPQPCSVRVWGDISSPSQNDATSNGIRHQADTTGGQSGSAYYIYVDPSCSGCGFGAYLVGIHRAGGESYNLARRYTSAVRSFMKANSSDY